MIIVKYDFVGVDLSVMFFLYFLGIQHVFVFASVVVLFVC